MSLEIVGPCLSQIFYRLSPEVGDKVLCGEAEDASKIKEIVYGLIIK
jgi:hypothetical protein